MTDENPSTVIVNMHGLMGEQEVIQMEFEAELLQEKEQFFLIMWLMKLYVL
jgi:hypothetical protein